MQKIEFKTEKTARYFMLGNTDENIEEIWIVCHGYGQLANYFLKKFECISKPKRLIIAPEGLHRFYWNGFSGRVVASWMTKEDRQSDIDDYITFLDNTIRDIENKLNRKVKVNVLGFSQGAATVCRWLSLGKTQINNLILWGSVLPDDIDYFDQKEKFNNVNLKIVIGSDDEYYSKEKIATELDKIKSREIDFDLIEYQGGHDLYEDVLLKVSS